MCWKKSKTNAFLCYSAFKGITDRIVLGFANVQMARLNFVIMKLEFVIADLDLPEVWKNLC